MGNIKHPRLADCSYLISVANKVHAVPILYSYHLNMELKHLYILIFILLLHQRTSCLDPQSYGTKESSGYKAAYAKAREMREARFAAQGESGPEEAALEQTFQVLRGESWPGLEINLVIGEIHHQRGASCSVLLLHRGLGSGLRPQYSLHCPQHGLRGQEGYQLPVKGSPGEDGGLPRSQGKV